MQERFARFSAARFRTLRHFSLTLLDVFAPCIVNPISHQKNTDIPIVPQDVLHLPRLSVQIANFLANERAFSTTTPQRQQAPVGQQSTDRCSSIVVRASVLYHRDEAKTVSMETRLMKVASFLANATAVCRRPPLLSNPSYRNEQTAVRTET